MNEFDQFAKDYSDKMEDSIRFLGKEHSFFTKIKAEKITELLGIVNQERLKILDAGCGVGLMHSFFDNTKFDVYGTDISLESIKVAEKEYPKSRFSHFNGDRFPYKDNYFDSAFTICVLHHIELSDRLHFISEICRVVKSSGLIIIAEHNKFNPITQYVVKTSPVDVNAKLLANKEAKSLLRENGVENIQSHYILCTPFEYWWAKVLENSLKKIPIGAQYLTWGYNI